MSIRLRSASLSLFLALLLAGPGLGCSALKRFAYEGFDRDEWQRPERVLAELALEPGMQVADIGAGGGYFTFKLADAVGPEGRVYAVDVDEDMLDYLAERAADEGYANVTVVRGAYGDPGLPDGTIDLAFTSNTYHHLEQPVDYFRVVRADLTPTGRVAILDLAEGPFFARDHFSEPAQIERDMQAAGYERVAVFDFIDEQSFQVFRPAPEAPAP